MKKKILIIILSYSLLFCQSNNEFKKSNNANKTMMHEILLLSSYGIIYMNNFLRQFNNDK